ncbi:MAG: HPr family phosphocarrier protein [Acholeplasmatales bacterium]|nr:HPr family phosphocarrier protein [Acholeplasmatales bacterium]
MEKSFKITAETGIHAQSAVYLVNEAIKYSSNVILEVEGKKINMKSIMGVMSLGVYQGAVITLHVDGSDETQALAGIENQIYNLKLGKEY